MDEFDKMDEALLGLLSSLVKNAERTINMEMSPGTYFVLGAMIYSELAQLRKQMGELTDTLTRSDGGKRH